LVTKVALPAGATVVAAVVELGAGFDALGAGVVDGAVDCAIALVNAKPLTAATAMIRFNI
jgi:hypothetical protein